MEPVLGHDSALEYWRSVRGGGRSFYQVTHAKKLLSIPPREDDLPEQGPWWLSRPLHLIVGNDRVRRTSKEVVSHVWSSSLPKGSVLDTRNGFYVCSPELTFLQAAERLSLVDLISLGFEWCGTYDASHGELCSCAPLTTVAKLESFLSGACNMRGRKRAQHALRFVLDGSASPRETVLVILLCLPYKMGGFKLAPPILNQRIEVGSHARKVATKQHYRCDLYWPEARLALEYDSDAEHLGSRKASDDSSRRNALDALGINVITVTTRQIASCEDMRKIAINVARHLGKRLQFQEPSFSLANLRLRTELLGNKKSETASI